MSSKNTSLPSCVEGVSGKDEICEVWKRHIERLLNCIQYDGLRNLSFDAEYSDGIEVTMSEVTKAVQALGVNKAASFGGPCDSDQTVLAGVSRSTFYNH